ncbi:hypothetical protein OA2633_07574 [Oceanicaulis sp. HTCC2633]|nr:hypothetical protein OA2633_07574 [Oceanicaulis sp. HTCC2633]
MKFKPVIHELVTGQRHKAQRVRCEQLFELEQSVVEVNIRICQD